MANFLPHSRRWLRAGGLFAALLLALPVAAQESGSQQAEGQQDSGQQESKVVPALRFSVGEQFNEAQICVEEGDIECAQEIVEDISRIRDLNTYERGQLYNFTAFLSFELDDTAGAIEAYQSILELPRDELPDSLVGSSMRNLATLYLQEERLEEGLELYIRWMDLPFIQVNSQDYALLASIYYQLERWSDGLAAIDEAIKLANDKGELGEENWYVMKYVFNYQLERPDAVIDTLTVLVENWTKRRHIIALAGQLSEQDREHDTLTLYEAAYESGFLEQGTEWVALANLYMSARTPVKAATVLQEGLDAGVIESTQSNWRLLAQAWQAAAEHEKALPALRRASELADDGQVDRLLAQSLARLADWEGCVEAGRSAVRRGDLTEPGYVNIQLGTCLMYLGRLEEAREAFRAALEDERRAEDADRFLRYVAEEMNRERENAALLASLRNPQSQGQSQGQN
jgi:tetratricopeptide (TPR) repeat protein